VWDVFLKCGHQLRIIAGMSGARVIGFDLGVVMAMATALHIDPWIVAELAPVIEAAAVRAMNEDGNGATADDTSDDESEAAT
jgi:hypothetical protein